MFNRQRGSAWRLESSTMMPEYTVKIRGQLSDLKGTGLKAQIALSVAGNNF